MSLIAENALIPTIRKREARPPGPSIPPFASARNAGDLLTRNVPQLADVLAERRSSRKKSNISTEGVKGAPLSEGKIAASAGAIPSTY
jgi:hypothetical protein